MEEQIPEVNKMVRLLRANFARLWKSKSFWVCLILAFALALANFLSTYSVQPQCVEKLGRELMAGSSNVVLFLSIFAALFLGTDYSNGTIRNKLVIGHTRAEIYFSNLVTTAASGVIMLAASWTGVLITGLCLGGKLGMPAGEFFMYMLISVCAAVAISALFNVIGMLIPSKSTIVTITLVSTFVLMIGAAVIMSMLAAPEYVQGYEMSVNGGVVLSDPEPNPMYISGVKRDILTAVNDILPSGQFMQLETGSVHSPEFMPLYSLGVLAAATAVGALVFRRKDLK